MIALLLYRNKNAIDPIEGIETSRDFIYSLYVLRNKNAIDPIEGIETDLLGSLCCLRLPRIRMPLTRLRGLRPVIQKCSCITIKF